VVAPPTYLQESFDDALGLSHQAALEHRGRARPAASAPPALALVQQLPQPRPPALPLLLTLPLARPLPRQSDLSARSPSQQSTSVGNIRVLPGADCQSLPLRKKSCACRRHRFSRPRPTGSVAPGWSTATPPASVMHRLSTVSTRRSSACTSHALSPEPQRQPTKHP
jgi:hypothetical protein